MQLADRGDFVAQLKILCAGFNVPFTSEREEAYWRGLERMQVSSFARVVTHALSERGSEKLPTVREVWALSRVLRRQHVAETTPTQVDALAIDPYTAFANRRLFGFLMQLGPVEPPALARLVETKNRVANQYRLIATEEGVTPHELATSLRQAFLREASSRAAA